MQSELAKYKRVLAVFAHPDDEAFGPGGALALLAQTAEVNLVCVTDGDIPGSEESWAKVRREELRRSAKILGIKEVIFLDLADGSLCNANYHQAADKIQTVVRRLKPELLITFEFRGVSGHLDHVAVSMVVSYVFRENRSIKAVWYWGELERKSLRLLRDRYFIFFPQGYKREEFDLTLDTKSVYDLQVKAMREHKSQKQDCDRILLMRKFWPKEEYFLVKKR